MLTKSWKQVLSCLALQLHKLTYMRLRTYSKNTKSYLDSRQHSQGHIKWQHFCKRLAKKMSIVLIIDLGILYAIVVKKYPNNGYILRWKAISFDTNSLHTIHGFWESFFTTCTLYVHLYMNYWKWLTTQIELPFIHFSINHILIKHVISFSSHGLTLE